jgi:hypothetical protein
MTNDYRARIMPADVALAEVQSGQRVYVHNGCAEPVDLVKALTRRGPDLHNVEVLHMATMGIADYTLRNTRDISGTAPCSSAATRGRPCKRGAPTILPFF